MNRVNSENCLAPDKMERKAIWDKPGHAWKNLMTNIGDHERRWLVCRLFLGLVWAVELFWVQKLGFEVPPWTNHPILFQVFRFGFDLVFTVTLSLLLRRRYLIPLLIGNLVLLNGLGIYAAYFHRPLMLMTVFHQWREGLEMGFDHRIVFSWRVSAPLLLAAAVKGWFLAQAGNYRIPAWIRWRIFGMALVLYGLPLLALQFTHFRLSTKTNTMRGIYAYGHVLPWICDAIGLRNIEEHVLRAQPYLTAQYDRLSPLETPLTVKNHIVVLQLETVGTAAIRALREGRPVMPFLNGLVEKSMFFRILSFHNTGSCDMDFAATTFTEPYPGMIPYKLPGIKYTNGMPQFMERYGYPTYFFHGNSGQFYRRLGVIEQLGFDHVFFKEQLASRRLESTPMGVRDAELLRCISEAVKAESRSYVFGITLDTHAPYNFLNQKEMEIFPNPVNEVERYFNSIRYLDRCLEKLVGELPDETTLVMYGDHTASLTSELFSSDIVQGEEYVGCLIYQKGADLSKSQRTRNKPIAREGTLNILDILSYLRRSVAESNSAAEQLSN